MRTPEEINAVIQKLETRLTEPEMANGKNEGLRMGYEKAVELLKRSESEYNVGQLLNAQAKAIAILSVDFVNGFEESSNFVNIPTVK